MNQVFSKNWINLNSSICKIFLENLKLSICKKNDTFKLSICKPTCLKWSAADSSFEMKKQALGCVTIATPTFV